MEARDASLRRRTIGVTLHARETKPITCILCVCDMSRLLSNWIVLNSQQVDCVCRLEREFGCFDDLQRLYSTSQRWRINTRVPR
jgi:hypothetical protein